MISLTHSFEPGISAENLEYLAIMRDVFEVSAACSAKTYFWGGFTIDILEGKFLREHGDLDGFTENMMTQLDELISRYQKKGFTVEFKSGLNMLVISRGGQHASFNPLDINQSVAMWRHIGDQGTVYFPYDWLDAQPRDFYDIKVYTSGLRFEHAFRSIASSLNPEWKGRDKDKVACEFLLNKLREQGIDTPALMRSIWSYNPYWLKYGYDPFDKPTLVFPTSLI
jgi:hypothetical protein